MMSWQFKNLHFWGQVWWARQAPPSCTTILGLSCGTLLSPVPGAQHGGSGWETFCPRIPRLALLEGDPAGGANGDRGFCAKAVWLLQRHQQPTQPPPDFEKFGMGLGEEGRKEERGLWGWKKEGWRLAVGALQWENHSLRQQCTGWLIFWEIQKEMQEIYYHKSESGEELTARKTKQSWREIPK